MLKQLYDLFIYLRYKDYIDMKLLETFGDEYIKNPHDYKAYKQALINKYKKHKCETSKNIVVKKLNTEDINIIKQKLNPGDILIIKDIDRTDNPIPYISIHNGPSLYAKLMQNNIKEDDKT